MANASHDLTVYLLVFVMFLSSHHLGVDPKPMGSWHGICKELEACLKPRQVLWGWGRVGRAPPAIAFTLFYRLPAHSGRGYARPSEHDLWLRRLIC